MCLWQLIFNPLHNSTNQIEKHLRNHSSHYADNFHYTKEVITCTTKLTPFAVSKDEWRTLVSPQRVHFMYCDMPKGTSRAEATLNSEKINLAVIELHLFECIGQLLSPRGPQ